MPLPAVDLPRTALPGNPPLRPLLMVLVVVFLPRVADP
jgi:hypothetical protein